MPINPFNTLDFAEINLWTVLSIAYGIYSIASAIYIISENRPPSVTLAWLLSFLALPFVGIAIYIFFGRNTLQLRNRLRLIPQEAGTELTQRLIPLIQRQAEEIKRISSDKERSLAQRRLVEMVRRTGLSVLTGGNQVEILIDAAEKYPRLIADIEAATSYVHMEYFTFAADPFMRDFSDLLIRKVQAGVEVRVLFDAAGSMGLLFHKRGFLNHLRRGGVKIYPYLNFIGLLKFHTINYRNHRKIAVIDGVIGYTGGMNMGEEQIKGAGPYDAWRDTHLRITGDAVAILQGIFATSWFNTTQERLVDVRYLPESKPGGDGLPVQILLSGPDSEWHAIQQLYFLMIMSAQSHVLIQSPYFIPSSPIAEALRVAALSGVKVKLMCARRDTAFPVSNWAANTYFLDMARAGVEVYLYQSAYLHSKTISIDGAVCAVGTANMDIRSFTTNYEMMAVLFDAGTAQEQEAQFEHDLTDCLRFDPTEYRRRRGSVRFRDSLARLVSPLL